MDHILGKSLGRKPLVWSGGGKTQLKHGLDNAAIQVKQENNSKGENTGPVMESALN